MGTYSGVVRLRLEVKRRRRSFRDWRGRRCFAGAVWILVGSVLLLLAPVATIPLILISSTVSIGILVGALVLVMGLMVLFVPRESAIAGGVAVILSLVGFVTNNLGGFLFGTVMGIIGGALAVSWEAPLTRSSDEPPPPATAEAA